MWERWGIIFYQLVCEGFAVSLDPTLGKINNGTEPGSERKMRLLNVFELVQFPNDPCVTGSLNSSGEWWKFMEIYEFMKMKRLSHKCHFFFLSFVFLLCISGPDYIVKSAWFLFHYWWGVLTKDIFVNGKLLNII